MGFSLHVENLRALESVQWSPTPLSVVVGENGAGKTTLLLVMKLLRAAYDRGLAEAVASVLGGSYALRTRRVLDDAPVVVGLDLGDVRWRAQLIPLGSTVDAVAEEFLLDGSTEVFHLDSLGNFTYRGHRSALRSGDNRIRLRAILDADRDDEPCARVAACLQSLTVFGDPDLARLRAEGSRMLDDKHLHSRGTNAFTMLRRWSTEKINKRRFEMVRDGIRAAFQPAVVDLDFEGTQTVTMRTYLNASDETGIPMAHEANGVLSMLVSLTAIAATPPGGLVAIDEPEHALHPFAIRELVRQARAWATESNVTVVFTTHSPVLLDEMAHTPDSVFAMTRRSRGQPVCVTHLKDDDWLRRFRLGELYAGYELGRDA